GIGLYANLVSNQGGIPRRDVEAAVVDSVSAYNGGSGFYAFNDPAEHYFATLFSISRSTSTFNEGFGIEASGLEVFLYFGQSMISDGARQLNGAEVWSYGDNYMQRVTAPRLAPKS
ncbi:MAG: hypothetical protein QOC56_741, partial [Alphaproteobacteria bacterium]|nr:hypothetical protein [Alphaproteobacteria bacterium]